MDHKKMIKFWKVRVRVRFSVRVRISTPTARR